MRGSLSWRQINERGEVEACAALKTLLHTLADKLPRMLAERNYQ